MNNFNERLRERWQKKKSKAANWSGLLVKVLLLIIILYVIQKLARSYNITWNHNKAKADTTQTVPVRP